jgi:PPIC-type PPIASE domain
MSFLARLVREPLVHFILIGAAVFAVYALVRGGAEERDRIVVTEGRVAQLAQIFTKTWQRPPTKKELRGLVDTFVKEEIYYREAVKLGLDRDDTLIRRRMKQKMEFLTEPGDDLLKATDADLEAFLDANRDEFRVEPRIAFTQVFINPKKKGEDEPAESRAGKVLATLRSGSDEGSSELGDPTLLPATVPLSSLTTIARDFGDAFAKALDSLPENEWSGPVPSPYGLHLVRVTERLDGRDPPLEEIRAAVEQKWRTMTREKFQDAAYETLRAQYEVMLPALDAALKQTGSLP